jgi:hypothetical protein
LLEDKEKFDEKQKFSDDKAYQGQELIKVPTKNLKNKN